MTIRQIKSEIKKLTAVKKALHPYGTEWDKVDQQIYLLFKALSA